LDAAEHATILELGSGASLFDSVVVEHFHNESGTIISCFYFQSNRTALTSPLLELFVERKLNSNMRYSK